MSSFDYTSAGIRNMHEDIQRQQEAYKRSCDEQRLLVEQDEWWKANCRGSAPSITMPPENTYSHFVGAFSCKHRAGHLDRIPMGTVTGYYTDAPALASDDMIPSPVVTLTRSHGGARFSHSVTALHDRDYFVWKNESRNAWRAKPKDDLAYIIDILNEENRPGWKQISERDMVSVLTGRSDLQICRFNGRRDSAVLAIISKHTGQVHYTRSGVALVREENGVLGFRFNNSTFFFDYPGAGLNEYREPDAKLMRSLGISRDQVKLVAIANSATRSPVLLEPGYYLIEHQTDSNTQKGEGKATSWSLHRAPLVAPGDVRFQSRCPTSQRVSYSLRYARSLPGDRDISEHNPTPLFSIRRIAGPFGVGFRTPKVSHIHSDAEMFWYDATTREWLHLPRESTRELKVCNGGRLPLGDLRKVRPHGLSGGQYVALVDKISGAVVSVVEGVSVDRTPSGSYRVEFKDAQLFYGYPGAHKKGYRKPSTDEMAALNLKESDLKVLAIVNNVTSRPLYIAPGFYLHSKKRASLEGAIGRVFRFASALPSPNGLEWSLRAPLNRLAPNFRDLLDGVVPMEFPSVSDSSFT